MPRTARVVILGGDYPDRLQNLWSAADAAKDDEAPLLNGEVHPYDALADAYKTLKAEAEAAGIVVEMQAVGRRVWRDLKVKHPPRTEGHEDVVKGDQRAGVNAESVEDDLVYASLTSPEFKGRDAFEEWADRLSEGEWQTLVIKAWELANGARLDPKELRPALPTRSTERK